MSVDSQDEVPPSSGRRSPVDVGLRSVVVDYESSADRRTVYPAGVPDHERLTRWLSADDGAFVALESVR